MWRKGLKHFEEVHSGVPPVEAREVAIKLVVLGCVMIEE
jgi:hypothetical protein